MSSKNELEPGATWTREDMPSIPHAVEIRKADGGKPFSWNENVEKAGQVLGACAAGTASVLVGAASVLGAVKFGWGLGGQLAAGSGVAAAGGLMNLACAGECSFP